MPLLVHLPASLRSGIDAADASALAFTSDLAPSLYALLGHEGEPVPPAPIFGRSLFARGQAPLDDRTGSRRGDRLELRRHLPGWLLDGGRRLYILDAVALRDYDYQLDGTAAGVALTVGPESRAAGRAAIRKGIEAIAAAYRFTPPQ